MAASCGMSYIESIKSSNKENKPFLDLFSYGPLSVEVYLVASILAAAARLISATSSTNDFIKLLSTGDKNDDDLNQG